MKIDIYLDVQDSDGYVFLRGVKTDSPSTFQNQVSPGWISPHRSYRVQMEIPDIAPIHNIEIAPQNIEEVTE